MADQLQDIVQRMVAGGESEADIALVIKSYKPTPAPAASGPAPEAPGMIDRLLADNPAVPPMLRGTLGVLRAVKANPITAGAIAGGVIAAPFTGAASIPAAMAASGLGAAGGAGLGSMAHVALGNEGGPRSAGDVAKVMATEGAAGTAGEGLGRGAAKLLQVGGQKLYKAILRPSIPVQKEFGDVAETGLREGVRVSNAGAARVQQRLSDNSAKVNQILTDKDAARPAVRGYLPEARSVSLGQPPIHPTVPELRDPRSAGVLLREGAGSAEPWTGGAPAQMIDPREIAARGLSRARADVADRALAGDALDEIGDLEGRFLAQRGSRPFSLQEAQRLKQAEQELAEAAYASRRSGGPVNSSQQQFHEGIARGSREAIEARAPEVAGLNKESQAFIGLNRALQDASYRNVPAVGAVRTILGDFMPGIVSGGAIAADRTGKALGRGRFNDALKTALIAALGGQQE